MYTLPKEIQTCVLLECHIFEYIMTSFSNSTYITLPLNSTFTFFAVNLPCMIATMFFYFCNAGHFETPPYSRDTLRSVYHQRSCDIYRLKQV